ncbi:unnamed protein product [Discula destructiva]
MGSYDRSPLRTALEDAHEASESGDGRREVKHPFAFKNLDWDDYHRYRPRYPESMLQKWLKYHQRHGGEFHCAHDVGAGPGTLAARLAPRFASIIVSDAGAANIRSAKENLATPDGNSRTIFIQSPAEQVYAFIPTSSVDFVSVGMAFHYFQAPDAIRSIAKMLKPGGTLAACTYGFRLRFPGRPQLEQLWYTAASQESLQLIREGRLFPAAVRGLANAMAGLDFVPLPTEWFEAGAMRFTLNADEGDDRPLAFVHKDPCWEPSVSRVGREDMRVVTKDPQWCREAGVHWLRGFLISCQMGFGERTWQLPEWRLLEEVVSAAEDGKVAVEWPVAMILATRNARSAE